MTVYLDELFALNFLVDYLLLSASAALGAVYASRVRRMLAALFGALYNSVAFVIPSGFMKSPFSAAVSGAAMTLISFGFHSLQRFIRRYGMVLLCCTVFAGFILLAAGGGQSGLRVFESGIYADVPASVIAAVCVCAYIILEAVLKFSASTGEQRAELSEIKIVHHRKTAEFSALVDTGNRLRDPVSGALVIICEADALKSLFPAYVAQILKKGLSGEKTVREIAKAGYGGVFRIIPYKTVGTDSAFLPVFRPEEIWTDGKRRRDVIVGVEAAVLEENAPWSAVMGTGA